MADPGFALGKVSIVIAVWNGERTLDRCLRSCEEQTYENKEIIVIDGASSDRTVDIIRLHASNLAHWVSEPDSGIYSAWNKALRVATGEWICFLGADDVWAETSSMALMMQGAKSPGVSFVSGKAQMVDEDGRCGLVVGGPWSKWKAKFRMPVAHTGALHHRSLFERHGQFDESYKIAGDVDFVLRAASDIRGSFIPAIIVNMESGGLSSRALTIVRKEMFRALRNSKNAGLIWAFRYYCHWWVWYVIRGERWAEKR